MSDGFCVGPSILHLARYAGPYDGRDRIDFPLVDDLECHDILFARSHTTFQKGAGTFSDVTPEADHSSWTNFMVDTFDYLDTAHTYFLRLRGDLVIS
ncbi:hypothetical protein HZH68_004780 [Vespula germanica]|uniref:Uncharacterized protein n=1 Tax=Vespula germanica TaxID=30212 RepID=A0A834KSF3_VESGE|nr:hypothetical protein HZH68_004780 [Vespula germanica]